MIKVNLLEARMKEQNVWYPELCEALNLKMQPLKRRFKGKVPITLTEVNKIRKFLNLTFEQANEIFYY